MNPNSTDPNEPTNFKHCPRCERDLPATLEYFYAYKKAASGLSSYCKSCTRKSSADSHLKSRKIWAYNQALLKARRTVDTLEEAQAMVNNGQKPIFEGHSVCIRCGLVKPLSHFYKQNKSWCKHCRTVYAREYRQKKYGNTVAEKVRTEAEAFKDLDLPY